jgi:hypothetical protein
LLVGVVLAGMGVLSPRDTRACSILDGPYVDLDQVPADGAIVARVSCLTVPCVEFSDLGFSVRDPSGSAVPGDLRLVDLSPNDPGYLVAFVPHAPLVVTHRYTALLEVRGAAAWTTSVGVEYPMADQLPLAAARLIASTQTRAEGNVVCCNEGDPCFESCLGEVTRTLTAIDLTWQGGSRHIAGQFAYRLVRPDGTPFPPDAMRESGVTFQETAPEYCARVEAHRLRDGAVFVGAPQCVPHGDMPELGARKTDDADVRAFVNPTSCATAPTGYEPEWCTALRAQCAMEPGIDCKERLTTCEGVPEPPVPGANGSESHGGCSTNSEGAAGAEAVPLGLLAFAALCRRKPRQSGGRGDAKAARASRPNPR